MTVRRALAMLGAALGAGALLALLALVGAALWYGPQLPSLERVTDYRPVQSLQVFTQDGIEIAQFGAERRQFLPIAQTPQRLLDAVLAVEDNDFYAHGGISWRGLARAILANLGGGMPQGASTITQQVARTFFLSTRRTAERKIKEALLALQIEQRLSKDQILELYLNQIYLGQRAYGFAAASQAYFGKPLEQLSIAETAMLAGLPQNPIWANPVANLERATRRQRIVLQRMRVTGRITQSEHDAAREERLAIRQARESDLFAEHVAEMARRVVFEQFGERAYREGLRVVTTIRSAEQRAAHAAIRRALIEHEQRQPYRGAEDQEELPEGDEQIDRAAAQALRDHRDDPELRLAVVLAASPREVLVRLAAGERVRISADVLKRVPSALWRGARSQAIRRGAIVRVMQDERSKAWMLAQLPEAEGAYVALDPVSGRITALVGSFDFNRRQLNHATQAWRQPGSSFKPFVYSAAFEQGVMPDTLVNDAPLAGSDGEAPRWSPKNPDGRFDGPITVREALARSKNLVSVRILQQIGVAAARQWAMRFGFAADRLPEDLTLALGSGSTTPMQLATAYAVLANGGHRIEPLLIERITDARGQALYEAPDAPAALDEATRVIPARNAFLARSLLAEVTAQGTAARAAAQLARSDIGGKTGTTNDAVDAWFAGLHATRVAVGWIGHPEPRSLGVGESGGGLALPVWVAHMAVALKGVPATAESLPAGITKGLRDWRYSEWAEAGAIEHIGLADELGIPAEPNAGAASAPR